MAYPRLPYELLLSVANNADTDTIQALVQTSKGVRDLIKTYERSICRERTAPYLAATPPGFPALLNGQPCSQLLSSGPLGRRVLQPDTIAAVHEVSRRQRRGRSLVSDAFLGAHQKGHLGSTVDAPTRFHAGLERALFLCDRIADIEAEVMSTTLPYASVSVLVPEPDASEDGDDDSDEYRCQDPADSALAILISLPPGERAPALMRLAQIRFVLALPARDLMLLQALTRLAGTGFARWKGAKLMASDPSAWDKITAFEEGVLRHGSAWIWAFARGRGGESRAVEEAVKNGAAEVFDWEHGDPGVMPGLHMSMMRAFENRVSINPEKCEMGELQMKLRLELDKFLRDC